VKIEIEMIDDRCLEEPKNQMKGSRKRCHDGLELAAGCLSVVARKLRREQAPASCQGAERAATYLRGCGD
jgi:hypothetical protein